MPPTANVCRRHNGSNRLEDLVRGMSILDGKPEPDHRHATLAALTQANWPNEGPFSLNGYFISVFAAKETATHISRFCGSISSTR